METKLLDLPISFFEYDHQRHTFANTPSQQTTLRRIVSTRFYQAPVEAICAESDGDKQDELKKQLPSFTPVANLRHRKKDISFEERIINQWPMGMGDIDKKDNPDVDMAELKRHIASLPYVLLCAYSVRRGLWFVVRLPDNQTPDTLAAHFRYLQRLFTQEFGIKLDSTKGGNPTALRFVSCDTEPYLNDEATVMEGTYTPPPPKRQAVTFDQSIDEDRGKLLKRLLKPVQTAGEGQRHESLLKAARVAGGFIAANRLDEPTAVLALETAASEWPMFDKSQKTIRDGIKHGLTAPIFPEIRERPVAWKVETRKAKTYADAQKIENTAETYIDGGWQPFDYSTEAPAPASDLTQLLIPIIEPVAEKAFKLPALIEHYWSLFPRPPYPWNKIRAHKAIMRCLEPEQPEQVVTTIEEQSANPGSILRPTEAQLQREPEAPCDYYPPELDEPNPPDAVPLIQEIKLRQKQTFFEWQRQNPYFSQLELTSLPAKQP